MAAHNRPIDIVNEFINDYNNSIEHPRWFKVTHWGADTESVAQDFFKALSHLNERGIEDAVRELKKQNPEAQATLTNFFQSITSSDPQVEKTRTTVISQISQKERMSIQEYVASRKSDEPQLMRDAENFLHIPEDVVDLAAYLLQTEKLKMFLEKQKVPEPHPQNLQDCRTLSSESTSFKTVNESLGKLLEEIKKTEKELRLEDGKEKPLGKIFKHNQAKVFAMGYLNRVLSKAMVDYVADGTTQQMTDAIDLWERSIGKILWKR